MADLQTVLRYVAYQNSNENPYENTRQVNVVVEDADGASSTTEISKSFSVVRVNDKPVVDLKNEWKKVLSGQMQAEPTRADGLDSSHRLVGVSSCFDDAAAVAEELCHGNSSEIMLRFESSWMMGGARVKITDLVAGYADIPVDILKGINLEIEPKSKVAICGSTGCGKSTTILCMLRILEPRSGKIEINHVNSQDVGLRALRRSVGLVPQDPVVFSGNIRNNLDPFFEFTDDMIWGALKQVQLAETVWAQGEGLFMRIKSDGANLSFGQRQLLCMARMILRQPGLLLLDECTSAIDPRTQELVQTAIRKGFPNSTMIVIAHRLETIMDFDQVVVMEQGRIVETGSVKALSVASGGYFNRMLSNSPCTKEQ
jgi:ABC-type multidrug transport system fused ATPase/permease subunit